jgi:hypothetical protein
MTDADSTKGVTKRRRATAATKNSANAAASDVKGLKSRVRSLEARVDQLSMPAGELNAAEIPAFLTARWRGFALGAGLGPSDLVIAVIGPGADDGQLRLSDADGDEAMLTFDPSADGTLGARADLSQLGGSAWTATFSHDGERVDIDTILIDK